MMPRCRACGSLDFSEVIDLGRQRPSGHFPGPGDPPRAPAPLHVERCLGCGLAQLFHEIPKERQFCGAYGYRSAVNETMILHLSELALRARQVWDTTRKPRAVLDIGCNDGTLLKQFNDAHVKVGIDPSPWLLECESGITQLKGFFPTIKPAQTFDLIFTVAMFYDLEEPLFAATEIRRLLNRDGLWVCELADWSRLVKTGIWDGICHEHLTYWTEGTFSQLVHQAGFEIVAIDRNDSNGGSVRFYMKAYPQPKSARQFIMPPPTDEEYRTFIRHYMASTRQIRQLIISYKTAGDVIHLYGASTKGNVVLQACDLGPELIEMAAERSVRKVGRTTATGIPIVDEAESRQQRPDVYLVGPWHFKYAIMRREANILNHGTEFIFPLPSVHVEAYVNRPTGPTGSEVLV